MPNIIVLSHDNTILYNNTLLLNNRVIKNNNTGTIMELLQEINLTTNIHPALDINSYINDGFQKVCDVRQEGFPNIKWYYENVNQQLMFSSHRSWVYFIVSGNEIVKVGESGNPLGIAAKRRYDPFWWEVQPKTGTESRFGRYRRGDGTDNDIRVNLTEEVERGVVSLWARQCKIIHEPIMVAGSIIDTQTTYHKDLEMIYLDHFERQVGCYPRENKLRK